MKCIENTIRNLKRCRISVNREDSEKLNSKSAFFALTSIAVDF